MTRAPNFEAVIKRERAARGLGPTEFAKLIGVSRPSLDGYEKKGQVPKLEQAALIAQRLGLTLDQLAGIAPLPDRRPDLAGVAQELEDVAKVQAGLVLELRDVASRLALPGDQAEEASETG